MTSFCCNDTVCVPGEELAVSVNGSRSRQESTDTSNEKAAQDLALTSAEEDG